MTSLRVANISSSLKYQRRAYYLWLMPAAIAIIGVKYYPLLVAFSTSLTDKTLFTDGAFTGLSNYAAVLRSTLAPRAVLNNGILLLSVPLTLAIALALAGLLYKRVHGSRIYEILLYLPMLPAVASISVVFVYMLSLRGPINELLGAVGLESYSRAWLADPTFAIWSIMLIMTWKRVSITLLLFMARMVNIERELFDAAAVDGASWAKTFRYIAIPQMRGVLYFAATIGVIEVFSYAFAYIFMLTQGGPFNSSTTLEYLVYQTQFGEQHVGRSMAVAMVLLACITVVGIALVRLQSADSQEELPS